MSSQQPDHDSPPTAGVLAPPPLFLIAVIGLAEALRWWRPIPTPGVTAELWRLTLAAVLFATAMLLGISAVVSMHRARTPVEPWKATRRIVSSGVFGLSRNPIYVAFLAVQLAYAWARPNGWGMLLLPLTIALLYWAVIVREERYLERQFGDEYRAYKRRVRRWL